MTINHQHRCELCGMVVTEHFKDDQGVEHHYCEHHAERKWRATDGEGKSLHHNRHQGHSENLFRDRFWISLVLTIPVLLYSQPFQELIGFTPPVFSGSQSIPIIFGSVIFWYGGWVFLKSAATEIKSRLPGMMTLISLAIVAAYTYSIAVVAGLKGQDFFWELTTLITVMLFGHWVEMRSVKSAQGALTELAKLLPDEAEIITKNQTQKVPLATLSVNDLMLIRPGAKIPADGQVIVGHSSVDESMITGESKPVEKQLGNPVIAGTINGEGSLRVKVTKIGEATTLAGIMRLVAQAQASRSRLQLIADQAARFLTIAAILTGVIALIGWLMVGAQPAFAVERTVSVLVIACPHALGMAVPLVTAISTSLGARAGVLVRERLALEAARTIEVVLFDKTGTLTKGEQTVSDLWPAKGISAKRLIALAAGAEADSQHSIGRAIVNFAKAEKIPPARVTNFKSLPGLGVRAQIEGKTIFVGVKKLFDISWATPNETASKTIVYVGEKQKIYGALAIEDEIRPESYQAIKTLKAMGRRVAMVTGDRREVADQVANALSIDEYFAEVLPEHKVDQVRQLQKAGRQVAMVGDGINDAPALTQANVGIAIGAGTDVAAQSAGIILVKNDPRDVVKIISLSQATYRKMVENLFWAMGYNVVAIPLAAGVLAKEGIILQPALAALLMSISTVIVALNALTLRKLKL